MLSHRKSWTKEWIAWVNLRRRCTYQKTVRFEKWGGRGITFCDRWKKFENFFSDMGICPPNHSLDRINNDKGYSPENCKWSNAKDQCRNTTRNRLLTLNGETLPLVVWSIRTGIKRTTITQRIVKGWSVEDALTKKVFEK